MKTIQVFKIFPFIFLTVFLISCGSDSEVHDRVIQVSFDKIAHIKSPNQITKIVPLETLPDNLGDNLNVKIDEMACSFLITNRKTPYIGLTHPASILERQSKWG